MIENVGTRIIYSGNGVATEFAYQFKIINKTDINVLLTDADGVETLLTKDYYVDTDKSIVFYPGYADGAEIAADEQPPVLPEGWKLTIYRTVPVTQETDLPDNYPFNNVEDIGDKLTMICQQLTDGVSRSLKTSISNNSDLDITVPWQAGKSFRISEDGSKLELTDDPAKVTPQVQSLLAQTQTQAQIATANATAAANSALDANIYAANAKSYMDKAKDYSENVNVFIPSVSSDGVLSWTNKAGIENPASVNIKGAKGDKGEQGEQGPQGIQGLIGEAGPQGEKGEKGDKGDAGATGPAGATGTKGDKGDAGTAATITIGTVTKGDTASVTNVGTATAAKLNFVLPKGDKGDTGAQGVKGEQGEQGAKGDTGPQGATGAAGAAATVTIGTVTTGEAGSSASVTNSGTTSAAVLNFTIPRGADGADGGVTVDSALSSTSTNPVQNKVINEALSGYLPFVDSYISDANAWLTNGYTKTNRNSTSNLPSVCTGADKWGVLFFIAENAKDGTGTQMFFPINGTYQGRIFVRSVVSKVVSTWTLIPIGSDFATVATSGSYNDLTNKPTIPSAITVDTALSSTSTNPVQNKAVYAELQNKVSDGTTGFALSSMTGSIKWRQGSQYGASISGTQYTGNAATATKATQDADGNVISSTYAKSASLATVATSGSYNDLTNKPTIPAAVTVDTALSSTSTNAVQNKAIYSAINSLGQDLQSLLNAKASTSAANTWTAVQTFNTLAINTERFNSEVVSGSGATPTKSCALYTATSAFTLDMSTIAGSLSNGQSTVFTARFFASSDYVLFIANAGTLFYTGSASDVAIKSTGTLLNIFMCKDSSGTLYSVVQATALSES